jgi:hypothetical protein
MSLPAGQPRFWVESRKSDASTIGVWYRADTMSEARSIEGFLTEIGNERVRIYEWIGLKYASLDGEEVQPGKDEPVSVPFSSVMEQV